VILLTKKDSLIQSNRVLMLLTGQSGVRLPAKCKNYFSAKNARIFSLLKAKLVLESTMSSNQYTWEKVDLSLGQSGRGYKALTSVYSREQECVELYLSPHPHMTSWIAQRQL
jgi:hypothetical protein